MSLRLVILILVGGAIATVLVVQSQMAANQAKPAGPITSATRPPDAQGLPEDFTKPEQIITACSDRQGNGDEAMIAQFVGLWTTDRDWEGEVTKVNVGEGRTDFELKYQSSGVMAQNIKIIGEIPGENYEIEPGGLLRYSGRIAGITIEPHPLMMDAIRIDGVTVLKFQKRRN